jgi:hypothetical protein
MGYRVRREVRGNQLGIPLGDTSDTPEGGAIAAA